MSEQPAQNVPLTDYEKATIEIENRKLKLAETGQALASRQARQSARTTLGSLLVALVSVFVSSQAVFQQSWLQRQAAADTAVQQQRQTKDQFELQAAQIVVSNDDPEIAYSKALALHELFPNRLSESWVRQFDPDKYCKPAYEDRAAFVKLVTEHPDQRERLAQLWLALYCEEQSSSFTDWLKGRVPKPR